MSDLTPVSLPATLTIKELNGAASIQDLGRPKALHLGFGLSGAADEYAFLAANKLVGNELTANLQNGHAAIEVLMGQINITAQCHCTISITGAPVSITLNGQTASTWQAINLNPADEVILLQPTKGLYNYIAVKGGMNTPQWQESRSQLVTMNNEFTFNQPLAAEQKIPLQADCVHVPGKHDRQTKFQPHFYDDEQLTLRFIPSPFWHTLPHDLQQIWLSIHQQISPKSNRMGSRILASSASKQMAKAAPATQLSQPVVYGTIQLTPNGELIVLMKEHQTIGGYPVLGTVIHTDLSRFSQKRPGEKVNFMLADIDFAQRQQQAFYQRFRVQKK